MKIDPRAKIIIVSLISTISVIADDLYLLLGILIADLIICILLKVDFAQFLRRAKHLIIIILSLTIIQSLFTNQGETLISVGNITIITNYGLYMSLKFLLRMSIIISSAMIIGTSDVKEMTDALIKLRLPYELAFMTGIAIRFLPDFKNDFTERIRALTLRGVNIKGRKIIKRFRVYSYLLSPAVITTIIRSRMLAIAMESRAFRAYKQRGMMRILKFSMNDYITIALSTLFFSVMIYLNYTI